MVRHQSGLAAHRWTRRTGLSAGDPTFSSSGPLFCGTAPITALTDGIVTVNPYIGMTDRPQWVEIDLGAQFNLSRLNIRRYYNDARTCHDVILQLSTNRTTWLTIFNNDADGSTGQGTGSDSEDTETPGGKDVLLPVTVRARYVRAWSN